MHLLFQQDYHVLIYMIDFTDAFSQFEVPCAKGHAKNYESIANVHVAVHAHWCDYLLWVAGISSPLC